MIIANQEDLAVPCDADNEVHLVVQDGEANVGVLEEVGRDGRDLDDRTHDGLLLLLGQLPQLAGRVPLEPGGVAEDGGGDGDRHRDVKHHDKCAESLGLGLRAWAWAACAIRTCETTGVSVGRIV